MQFMLVFNESEGVRAPTAEGMAVMGKYAQELARAKKLLRGFPLAAASEGATARVRDGKAFVIDGPFPETKEHVAGVWIVEAADRAEALEIAKRCPHTSPGRTTEVHAIAGRYVFDDSEKGRPFILVFHLEPGFVPDPAKGREMMEFGTPLVRDGVQFETAHLGGPLPRGRLEAKDGQDPRHRRPVRRDEGPARRLQPGARRRTRGGDRARQTFPAREVGPGRGARDPLLRSGLSDGVHAAVLDGGASGALPTRPA